MARTKARRSRSNRVVVANPANQDRIARIVALLNEVARLMQDGLNFEPQAFNYLKQLQRKIRKATRAVSVETGIPLPTFAPEKWLDRENRNETAIDFIRRVYRPWIGKGLSRPLIRQLDRSLYLAMYKYLATGGNLPADLDLPTRKQINDRKLEKIGLLSGKISDDPHEAGRLYQLAMRRAKVVD